MAPNKYHFFERLFAEKDTESFETILQRPGIKIERIVSNGHHSAVDFWYEQDTDEWLLLLSGSAELVFIGNPRDTRPPERLMLAPGQAIFIAASQRHRVASTASDQPTVWLAIHVETDRCTN